VARARAFRAEHGLTFPLYTDPTLGAYRAAGLRHGPASSLDPRIAARAIDALRRGFRQVGTQGPALQQGGTFVIAAGGRLLFQHVNRFAGDNARAADIVKALSEIVPGDD